MKELKILKDVEKEVEAIFLHCQALSDFYGKYPMAVKTTMGEFQLKDYRSSDFIPDDIDNLKIRIYAEIMNSKKVNKEKKERERKELIKRIKK